MSISQLSPCEPERKMWRWLVSVLLLVHRVSPKPAVDDENARQPRQLDFGECCPCSDKAGSSFRNQDHWFPKNGRNFEFPGSERSISNDGMEFSRSGFDDCPCRSRGADSEGSSSLFFPSALRPGTPSKSLDSKEDIKNLLEPEVGLASSVLETLREATDEEYRDALARDAARSRASEDATPEESAQNIITIILPNANDEDIIPGASHVQEARCIHPLGRSLGRTSTPLKKRPNIRPDVFRVPKSKPIGLLHRSGFDMDSGFGASNVQERIVSPKGNNKLNTNPSLMKNAMDDVCEVGFKQGSSMKTDSSLRREDESPQRTDTFKRLNNPKVRMNTKFNEDCNLNNDMRFAASDRKEMFTDIFNPGLKLGPLMTENDPLNIKNLLKLRDVELIPPGQLIEKLKLGQSALQIPSLIENMPKLSDLLKHGIKFDSNKNKWSNAKNDKSLEDSSSNTNIQVIPREKSLATEILDTLPSTSNINEVQDNGDVREETKPKSLSPTIAKKTEIIESLPNSFQQIENIDNVVTNNDLDLNGKSDEDDSDLRQSINKDDTISYSSREEQSISDFESQKDTQARIINDVLGQDFGASDCLDTVHDDETSSENSDEILPEDVSSSDIKPFTIKADDQLKSDLNSNSKTDSMLKNQKAPFSQTLKSVQDSILRRIADRTTPKLNKADKLRKSSNGKNTENPDKVEEDCNTEPSENTLSLSPKILNTDDKKQKKSKALQLEDLQKLSDTLLKKSLLKEKTSSSIEHDDCDDDIESNTVGRSIHKSSSDNQDPTVDSDTESNNQFETEIRNPSSFDLIPQSNERNDDGSTCTSSTDTESSSKSLRTGIDVNEMAAEASEPIMGTSWQDPLQIFKDTNLGSPLFQNIVVEPSSLFEGLRNPQIPDLGAALNLPTLDDIRERLANVFSRNDKDSTDENIDCPNTNPMMSAEPSTSNFISRSPSIPLQDLNLDIFQLKPLTPGKSNTLSKIPSVNLKSFKTKVPVPNNLELKPLRLQSTVGNEGGLLGATLTLGRDSTGIPKILETLGNPPQNLPTLNEMMTRMRTNVENLVNSPLDLSRNIDPIPRIDDITNSLRSNTENAIRALQGRIGSNLGQPNNLLSNSPAAPEDILERIADAKEDMEAKLKGLHYDLNDRLTSIHENILDNTGLSSLNSLFEGKSLSRNAFNNNNQFKKPHTPISKRLKADNKKEIMGKAANLKTKPSSERRINSNALQRKFKVPAAASVPVPKTIEAPKLKSSLDRHISSPVNDFKPRLTSSRMNSENNNLPNLHSKSFPDKGVIGKHASSFKEKKVKVTFGSTTPAPIPTLKSQQRSKPDIGETPSDNSRRADSGLVRRLGMRRIEPNESPSEPLPARLRSPKTSEPKTCAEDIGSIEDAVDNTPFMKSSQNNNKALRKQENIKSPITSVSLISDNNRNTNNSPALPFPSLPKIDDNSFLSKVREAVKARLSSFEPKAVVNKEANTCPDMERSASENTNVAVGENLKENVSYKCKMVCTRS